MYSQDEINSCIKGYEKMFSSVMTLNKGIQLMRFKYKQFNSPCPRYT